MDQLRPHSATNRPPATNRPNSGDDRAPALSPLDFIERTAIDHGGLPSVVYNQRVYTWSETYHRCLRLASALSSHFRIAPGDVVSVISPNIPAMYEMHFGVPMSGAVLNTISTRLDSKTISVLLHHSECRLLFVDLLSLPLTRSAFELFPADHRPPVLIPIEDPYEDDSDLTGFDLTYEKVISLGDPDFQWIRPKSEWSPMILNYTSGTTSAPKGVVHNSETARIVTSCALMGYNWNGLPAGEWARMKAKPRVIDVFYEATSQKVPSDGFTMGEVVLRGGHVMLGYLKDNEAMTKAFKDGWFYTGDVGVMHRHSYLEIKHMSKDAIDIGGENDINFGVESILYGHPAVKEAAVVVWPTAFIELKEGIVGPPPTEAEMIDWCRRRMPSYMVPKTVAFLSKLPKTSTGKREKLKIA